MALALRLLSVVALFGALAACGGGGGGGTSSSPTTFNASNYSLPATLSTVPDQSTLNNN